MQKPELRKHYILARTAVPRAEKIAASRSIAEAFFTGSVFSKTDVIGGYWPHRGEVDARPIIEHLANDGMKVCLPYVKDNHEEMGFREYSLNDGMRRHPKFGLYEPKEDKPEITPTVLLVPMVAFDRNCHRLGYGKGMYDKYLSQSKYTTVGLAYACQECEDLPIELHDQALDCIITEKEVISLS